MGQLRVGIFSEVYHPTINGVVVSIDTFKKELSHLGVHYTIFAPKSRGTQKEEDVIRLPALPLHPDYPLPLPWLSNSYRNVDRLGLNLIHTQHPFVMGYLGLKTARRLRLPIVTTYHTLIVDYAKTHASWLPGGPDLMRFISKKYCNQVDLIITPSPSMRRELKRYGVTKPIEVNQTGIYLDRLNNPHPNLKQEFGIPVDRRVLIFVGRLADEKNVAMLIKAFAAVRQEQPLVHLLLVGGGPQEKSYRRLAERLGIMNYITFAGFVPKEKTESLFGAADLFVFPSITDTQGIVIMEAMAAGTPIVAVDALGPGDIIRDGQTGLLTTNNPGEFALAILEILKNRLLARRLSQAAKEEVRKYSAQETARRQLKIYQSLLN